jgi:hypothetical protein
MTLRIVALIALAQVVAGCTTRDDDFMVFRRVPGAPAGDGTLRLAFASPNDAEASYVHYLLADGFGAEMLRTYAMTKRFAARTGKYDETPTYLVLGDAPPDRFHDREVSLRLWREKLPAAAPINWIDSRSTATTTNLISGLAGATADVVAPDAPAELRSGYVEFVKVVGAEWRPPQAIDDRDELRRLSSYARVRANDTVRSDVVFRRAAWLVTDPDVIATVLYRMASALGQQMAPEETYAPFLTSRAPRDVHPALLLGAFRNFQAKLLAAWSGAVRANWAPRDLVDLVEAYGKAYPDERAEATRILLITTYGGTVLAHPPHPDEEPERVASQLAMLTADVLFGRRGLRDGYSGATLDATGAGRAPRLAGGGNR